MHAARSSVPAGLEPFHHSATLALFFASGFTGLVYEIVWMRELGLLFGNTAHAAATTLAAFFLGLVVGARVWGKRTETMRRPLASYAGLEIGVAITAFLYFLLLDAYHAVYAGLFEVFGNRPLLFLAVKSLLAVAALFPPSFFMGGTLPVMSQHLVRRRERLGTVASLLYGVNTFGAALGACAAGFYLPRAFGFTATYIMAVAVTVTVAVIAWLLSKATAADAAPASAPATLRPEGGDTAALPPRAIWGLALFSGFGTLSLEVLWIRMWAQVFQNSVYTFATILVTFLVALALGAAVAHGVIRSRRDPLAALLRLLTASAILIGVSPFLFSWLTDGLSYFGGETGFGGYLFRAFGGATLVMLPPVIALGSIFPLLMKLVERSGHTPGRAIGDLAAVNTVGAVTGSLVSGFVMLGLFGLWPSIRFVAAAYFAAAILAAWVTATRAATHYVLPVTGLLLLVSILDPARLPVVRVDPLEKGESVLQTFESSAGIVSVVRQPSALAMKLDNDYSLGSSNSAEFEQWQARLPLLLHPHPRSVFFLGMGTGITAGAALQYPVERVVVAEIVPKVVDAARLYFAPYLNGLFEDPRAMVLAEDGRNYLFGTSETFDVIVADLFMPWKSGVGDLYSRENYEVGLERLNHNGIYVQWLPLYQLSHEEFGVIAGTMQKVFPLVTMWRGNFAAGWETTALIGHNHPAPFDRERILPKLAQIEQATDDESPGLPLDEPAVARRILSRLLIYYCGNLSAIPQLFDAYAINTDDHPVIEYLAPVTNRRHWAREVDWFIGEELIAFLRGLLASVPPADDPYLDSLREPERNLVTAGFSLYLSEVLRVEGDEAAAQRALEHFARLAGADVLESAPTDRSTVGPPSASSNRSGR